MTQLKVEMLDKLKAAVTGLASGEALINRAANLPQETIDAIVSVVNEAKNIGGRKENGEPAPRLSVDEARSLIKQIMFLSPRGKQDLAFFEDRFVIKAAKSDVVVPTTAVQRVVILDSIPKDTKNRVWIYLHLAKDANIMNGKTRVTAVVLQVTADQQLEVSSPKDPSTKLSGLAAVVVCQSLGAIGIPGTSFTSPDPDYFVSSDEAAGVEAFVKARQGFLFPLPQGLCFLESPAMFIPLGDIRSVELARATGASSTFDMYVHCRDGTTTEFSNLSRNEIGAIEAWVRATSVGVGPASDDEEEGQSSGGDDGGSDSSDADDEDFNPEAEAKAEARDATGRAKKRRKLAAVSNGDEGGEGAKAVIGAEEGGLEGDSASEGDASSSDSDENSESDSDSDDSGSVELVSEDEFSVGQLKSMMEEEAQGKGALQ